MADEHFAPQNTLLLGNTLLPRNTFCFLEHFAPQHSLLPVTLCFPTYFAVNSLDKSKHHKLHCGFAYKTREGDQKQTKEGKKNVKFSTKWNLRPLKMVTW